MGGYMGRKLLDVNLSKSKIDSFEIDEMLLRLYLGGKGLGARLLYDNVKKGIAPLLEDNVFIVATGPITGTNAPCSTF